MIKRLVAYLDESSFACALLLGVTIAAAVVLGVAALVTAFLTFFFSPWWALVFVLSGILTGAAASVSCWLKSEYY